MVRLCDYRQKQPMLRSPKRKLRETAFWDQEPYLLGSRLGLQGNRSRSVHHQNSRGTTQGLQRAQYEPIFCAEQHLTAKLEKDVERELARDHQDVAERENPAAVVVDPLRPLSLAVTDQATEKEALEDGRGRDQE